MSHRARLQPFADTVKAAGLEGKSMTDALRNVAHEHDLTQHQIHRVAEIANRDVQLTLQKSASDKRFKFDLADPFKITEALAKTASAPEQHEGLRGELAKVAALGGDPFAAPDLGTSDGLSLYQQPLEPIIELGQRNQKIAATLAKLTAAEFETSQLLEAAKEAKLEIYRDAVGSHKRAVDDAAELVMGGITLPSLYQAMAAAVSGSAASDAERETVDSLALMIIQELKDRGIPNHRMGFRYKVNLAEIDNLSADDLVALCKRSMGCECGSLTMETQKSAARYIEGIAELHALDANQHPYQEAGKWLGARGAITQYPLQAGYLDEKLTQNQTGSNMRMINGDSEFVIAVRDLVGAQDRMYKNHNSQAYLGMKLKQIQEAIGGLRGVHAKTAELLTEAQKSAFIGGLIAKGVNAIGNSAVGSALSGAGGSALGSAVNIGGGALSAVAAKQQIDMNRRDAKQQAAAAPQTSLT